MIGNADIEGAHIAVGRNRRSANHRIVDRDAAKRRAEVDGYGISGGGDIDVVGRVVNRGVNPYGDIERHTAAKKQGAPGRGQSAAAKATCRVGFDPGEQFDIIVLNEVLYYMPEAEAVLERYESFLAPGGVLIISMYRVPESLCAWRRCAPRLEVLDSVLLRGSKSTEWNIWLCRPKTAMQRGPN
jgi:SAM-dependent methyltransferase